MATEGDPEFGISRGRLMPTHRILDQHEVSAGTRERLQQSLVLVHGGMAQNVGPILEMVTEKYLLRSPAEWAGRRQAIGLLDEIVAALRAGDVRRVGELTTRNFFEPIQTIIPWAGECVHRIAHFVRSRRVWRGILGVLDAGRHGRGRHGLHF